MGMGTEMRLCESLMNSEVSLDQPEELTEEDKERILMIGGIQIFFPLNLVEVRDGVAEATDQQPVKTIKKEEEGDKILEDSQAAEEEDHFEKWIKIFS